MSRAETVAKCVSEASPLYRNIMLKAYEGRGSARQAIKAACLSCVGFERESITHCTGYSCPLWAFRPYQKAGAEDQ